MDFKERHEGEKLPPLPGTEQIKQVQPPLDAIPLYIQGMVIPLTESESLGVIAQIASALQTRRSGVVRNG
jgi:hypothetical protein